MGVFHRMTIKSLLRNKTRTIITIVGVIFSVIIINSIILFSISFKEQQKNFAINSIGVWETEIFYLNKADEAAAIEYYHPQKVGRTIHNGTFVDKTSFNINLIALDDGAYDLYAIDIVEGRRPNNNKEVVISKSFMEFYGIEYKLGESLSLEISDLYCINRITNEVLSINPKYDNCNNETGDIAIIDEHRVRDPQPTYQVVGVISNPRTAIYTYLDNGETYDAAIMLMKLEDSDKAVDEFITLNNNEYQVNANSIYLSWTGSKVNVVLFNLTAILLLVFSACSILMIYNSFAMSYSQRRKQFGIISSVGATPRQIYYSILTEGVIIFLIGTPLGMIISDVFFRSLVQVINGMFVAKEYNYYPLNVVYSPLVIFFSCFISLIVILVSCYIPSYKAIDKSAIEVLRENDDKEYNSKQFKVSKWIGKLFGLETSIAIKNSRRSKKQYRSITLTIIVSIVMYVMGQGLLHYEMLSRETYLQESSYDLATHVPDVEQCDQAEINDAFINMKSAEGVTNGIMYQTMQMHIYRFPFQAVNKEFAETTGRYPPDGQTHVGMYIEVIAVDQESFKNYASDLGLDYRLYTNIDEPKFILYGRYIDFNRINSKYVNLPVFNANNIDKIVYESQTTNEDGVTYEHIFDIPNITIVDKSIPLIDYSFSPRVVIIIPEEMMPYYATISNSYYSDYYGQWSSELKMAFTSTDIETSQKEMNSILGNYTFESAEMHSAYTNENTVYVVVSYVLMLLTAIIIVISFANIINTAYTSIIVRKKEFAVLSSIGMKYRQISKMIITEYLYLAIKGAIYSFPLCIGATYYVRQMLTGAFLLEYTIPYKNFTVAAGIFIIIMVVVAIFSLRTLKSQNVIESIREENI